MQAGARRYPEPPFPKQHHPKPGEEANIDPAPMFEAPFYIGSRKLDGKVCLITGGDSGIGRAVAVLFAREGADIAISYLSENKDAETTKEAVERESRRCISTSWRRDAARLLPRCGRRDGRQTRSAGCAGQQCRVPDSTRVIF